MEKSYMGLNALKAICKKYNWPYRELVTLMVNEKIEVLKQEHGL